MVAAGANPHLWRVQDPKKEAAMTPVPSLSFAEGEPLDPARRLEATTLVELIRRDMRVDRRSAEAGLERLSSLLAPPALGDLGAAAMPIWQRRLVIRYIDENLAGAIECRDLAKLVGLSRSYFARLFKGAFGEGPRAFVIRRRVELSKVLMLQTSQRLCDIALAAGFADQSHMTRQFHQLVGETPSAWRRMGRAIDPALAGQALRLAS
jgi:AraC family transcriptional regulator